ncbi:LAMI_0F01552g1_1 [Lachancea mirantina]|uniref:LAMI_0F01552g1_1 n=1 Tax=Lachancea mirantina TaxID=1230905 RepID=A0A1G4JW07_9SACH|nr:LAMI_0F01552g1_1 [Lachancea mirantina]
MNAAINVAETATESLKKHMVIPDVIKDQSFKPWGLLAAEYSPSSPIAMGNTLLVKDTQSKPKVHFTLDPQSEFKIRDQDLFTLVLTDPDAPSREDHKWSEYCHFVEADIRLPFEYAHNSTSAVPDFVSCELRGGRSIVEYQGPAPPKNTGKHRYVLMLFKQPNDSSKFTKIADRPNWGYGTAATGIHKMATENHLQLIAANFFYAQAD